MRMRLAATAERREAATRRYVRDVEGALDDGQAVCSVSHWYASPLRVLAPLCSLCVRSKQP